MTPNLQKESVIPAAAWVIAVFVALLMGIGMSALMFQGGALQHFEGLLLIPLVGAFLMGSYIVLVGYVYGDAQQRGMRYVMWTWLAILIPNGIGIILYFVLRDPLPVYCSKCGSTTRPGFAYCPRCGAGMGRMCPQCQRVSQPEWSHCAHCGAKL